MNLRADKPYEKPEGGGVDSQGNTWGRNKVVLVDHANTVSPGPSSTTPRMERRKEPSYISNKLHVITVSPSPRYGYAPQSFPSLLPARSP